VAQKKMLMALQQPLMNAAKEQRGRTVQLQADLGVKWVSEPPPGPPNGYKDVATKQRLSYEAYEQRLLQQYAKDGATRAALGRLRDRYEQDKVDADRRAWEAVDAILRNSEAEQAQLATQYEADAAMVKQGKMCVLPVAEKKKSAATEATEATEVVTESPAAVTATAAAVEIVVAGKETKISGGGSGSVLAPPAAEAKASVAAVEPPRRRSAEAFLKSLKKNPASSASSAAGGAAGGAEGDMTGGEGAAEVAKAGLEKQERTASGRSTKTRTSKRGERRSGRSGKRRTTM
jgi:hypothetical protein